MNVAASVVVPLAVVLLSLTISFDLALADFRRVLSAPRVLAVGTLAQFAVLPLLALLLSLVVSEPSVIVALLLVALAPSGPTSNYLSALGRGDVSFAVVLTVLGSLISVATLPVFLPVAMQVAGLQARGLAPSTTSLLMGLVSMVLIPIGIGMFAAHRWPAVILHWRPQATRIASCVFVLLIAGAILAERRALAETFARSAHWVLLLNLSAIGAGVVLAKLARLPRAQSTTLGIKCAVQNVSIALAVSITLMGRLDIAAIVGLYGICQLITALAFALYRRRRG